MRARQRLSRVNDLAALWEPLDTYTYIYVYIYVVCTDI